MSQIVEILYTVSQVGAYLSIPEAKLRYWLKIGLCFPSSIKDGKLVFSFSEIAWIKRVKEFLEHGVKPPIIRRAREKYKDSLSKVKLDTFYGKLIVEEDGKLIEFATGQVLLKFNLEREREAQVTSIMRREKVKLDSVEAIFIRGYEMEVVQRDLKAALRYYKEAIEKDPEFYPAYINIGNIYYKLGYPEEAKLYYIKAIDINPQSPHALYNLGYLFYEEGDYKEALHFFEATIKYDPFYPEPYFHIGFCYDELGEKEKAKFYWKKYLEFEPEGPWSEIVKFFFDKGDKEGEK